MKLRLPVRLKLAVLAGLRSVVQATLASGFLAVGAVFFSFSAQAEDDPVALEVAEDEDEAAVPVDDEAPASGLGVSAAELNDSQAAALAEAEQEHAAELGINATSSAVSQAAIEAQDAAVSPAQAAGGSHADSFAAVPAADSPALTLPAAEGAVAPSLCAEGAADFATDYAPIKTASVAVLPQASTSLTLPEDVVMASSPVAEAAQTSSSSTSAAVSSSSSSGGAVACGGGAAGGGGGSSASFSASVPVTDVSSSGFDLPSDSVVSAEDPALSPSEPSPSLPDDSELVDTSPSSDSSSLSDAASLSSSLSASASTTGASSSSPAARSFSLKLLGATATSESNDDSGTSETVADSVTISGGTTVNYSDCTSATSITLAGGTLVIDAELQDSPTITASAASTVQINQKYSLASSAISGTSSTNTITLQGAGTYTIAYSSTSNPSIGNARIGDDWTGTVSLSGSFTDFKAADLNAMGQSGSTVEFNGASGYWATGKLTYSRDIKLTDNGNVSALTISNGYSTDTSYTFSGSISGEGTFELNKSTDGTVTQNYTFSGDISNWTGIFKDTSNFTSLLTFSNSANNINVQLKDVDKLTLTGSNLFTIANSFSVTGNDGLVATGATGGVKLSPKSGGTETTCSVSQAFNAGSNAVTVESGVTLTVGGLMTAGAFTNSGTVSLNDGASLSGAVTNSGTLTIGGSTTTISSSWTNESGGTLKFNSGLTVNSGATLTNNGALILSSTLDNSGTLSFGAGSTIGITDLSGFSCTYSDELGSGTTSGYLTGATLISGSGSIAVDNRPNTLNFGNLTYSITYSDNTTATFSASSKVYYVNTGDSLLYGADDNSLSSEGTTRIVLNGGTMEIGATALGKGTMLIQDSSLKINQGGTFASSNIISSSEAPSAGKVATNGRTLSVVLNGGTLSVDSVYPENTTISLAADSALSISAECSVDSSSITKNSHALTLGGAGTYNMGTLADNGRSLSANGISLGDSWIGVLKVSSAGEGWKDLKLNDFVRQADGVAVSSVELAGVTAWMNTETIKANVILFNPSDNAAAFIVDNGSSDKTYTFKGKVSGSGDMKVTATGPNNMTFSFEGGLAEWTGSYIMAAAGKTSTIKIAGSSAQNVNAAIERQNGTLNITTSATGGVTFANSINASSLTATTALTLNAKGEGTVATTDQISGALNAGANSVTVGQNVTLTVGGMTTAGSLTNAGTANLNGGATISGDLTNTGTLAVGGDVTISSGATWTSSGTFSVSGHMAVNTGSSFSFTEGALTIGELVNRGTVTIGAEGKEVDLSLGGMLLNAGALSAQGNIDLVFSGDMADMVTTSHASFTDALVTGEGATQNGFVSGGNLYVVLNQGDTATGLDTSIKSVTVNGKSREFEVDGGGVHFSAIGADVTALQNTYFVNAGNVVYRASDNSTGNPKVTELRLTCGTLELASWNLDSGVSLLVTGDGAVAIGEGRTLSEEVLTVSRGELTLTGAGTYLMAAKDFGTTAALTEGVVLGTAEDASFTGTVWLSSGTTLAGTDLSGLTNGNNSTVTLNGVSGYLKTDEISTKLVLTNNGAMPALAINNGTNNDTRTFSGSISGTGTMARTNRMDGNSTVESGGTQNFKFTGDIAGWTGVFDNQVSLTTNLTFGGNATMVNATLKHTAKGGELNVTTGEHTNVIFNGGMSVTSLTAGSGSTITLNGNSKVSGEVSGSFVVGKGGSLTVGGAASLTEDNVASLTSLTVSDGGSVTLKGAATATGAVTVSRGGYLALGTGGLTLSGEEASLTLENGAIVALQGWTATTTEEIDYLTSGVKTTGYSGGRLFTRSEGATGSTPSGTNVDFTVVKDGASFTGDRVTVGNDGTVTITNAVFYNVASNDTKTVSEATGTAVDYINVLGTLTGVNDTNIASLGVGASDATGVYGDGTLSLVGKLTDGYYLSSFTGTIAIGAGSTFETDGNVDRTIKLGGGTLHATADMTLKNVSAAGNTSNKIEVDAGKAVIITSSIGEQNATASITKTGEGTLTLGAINNDSGNYIRGTMYGDLTVEKGEVVLVTPNDRGGDTGTVVGNITIKAGGTVTANGIDPLGYSNNTWSADGTPTCTKTLTMSGEENAYAILNIASGQHVTLSTEVYMNGYAQINGRLLNAWSSTQNTSGEQTAYVKASGLGNVINADFYLRHHALFEVDTGGELSLNGSILKFTLGGAFEKPIFRKSGAGKLILDSPTATTLYNLRIEEGEVRISTDLSFDTASALEDFSMTNGSRFTVVDDGRFTYGGWTYEMKDGSSAVATVTAGADTTGALLSQGGITIANTKLTNTAANTNTATNTLTISAKLANVAFTQDNSGSVTIANAAGTDTQHLSSLAVNAGSVTLNSAQLDAAKVASGATLNFTKGTTITLGSTIQNAGTVALTGTEEGGVSFAIDLNNLSGFDVYGTAGYSDAKYSGSSDQDVGVGYNGFYKGQTYYLVKNTGGSVELSGATITGAKEIQTGDGGSIYFTTSDKDTKYYINNSSQADTNYKYSADAENSMYGGYLGAEASGHFATSGIVMNAENGRLILATNLQESVSDGIIMNKAGSITVESGVTLKQSSLNVNGTANATLKGAGIYEVGSTALSDIAEGFTDTDWKGTVQVSGAATEMKLSYMGHAGSTVQMTGVHGTLEDTVTDAKTYAMNIALVNGAYSAPALEFTANNGSNITFSGAMSGAATNTDTGAGSTMKVSGATAQTVQNITFTGDMSGWNGAFEAGKGTVNLTLTGDATVVNAGIGAVGSAGILNVTIDATKDRIFNKEITAENLTVDTQTGESTGKIVLQGTTIVKKVADLTAETALLQVQGDGILMASSVNLAGSDTSGINIASLAEDGTSSVVTTIRTNVPTTHSTQAEEGESGERVSTSTGGTITNAMFVYDKKTGRAEIVGLGTGRIENTIIDLAAGSTLELGNMVLADTVKITDASAKMISTNNVVELGSNNAKVNTTAGRDLGGVTLQKTGSAASAEGALTNVSGKVYTIDFTGIQNVEITSGTLTFDFNAYSDTVNGRTLTGFDLFYELGKTYDYIAVNFAADSADSSKATIQYPNLKVKSQITNGQGATATSTGYYIDSVNGTATSGVVVYFDALALPEPTTSTLALLALTALCARRRRPQPTR